MVLLLPLVQQYPLFFPPKKKKLAESGWRFCALLSCCLTYLSSHVQSEWLFADGMLFI